MRRRPVTNVWPAVADLMTALAVVGLGMAFVALQEKDEAEEMLSSEKRDLWEQLQESRTDLEAFQKALAEAKQAHADVKQQLADALAQVDEAETRVSGLELQLRAAGAMQDAVASAEQAMLEVASLLGQDAGDDLSISFGNALVTFGTGEVRPKLSRSGQAQLRTLCETIDGVLSRDDESLDAPLSSFTRILVEGHTDGVDCPRNPGCNWTVSAVRASRFRELMEDQSVCPGSEDWTIRPVGLANTSPRATDRESRRIQIRIVPDYAAIVEQLAEQGEAEE